MVIFLFIFTFIINSSPLYVFFPSSHTHGTGYDRSISSALAMGVSSDVY